MRPQGLNDDREYGLIDASTGQPAAPEKDVRWRKALHLTAASPEGELPVVTFPDGRRCSLNDVNLNGMLTEYFGFAVAIAAYEHTRWRVGFPLTRYRHPHSPLHVLTTSSLERLAELSRKAAIDSRRFRPTVLVEVDRVAGFVESDWIGRRLRLGSLDLRAEEETKRCGVSFASQPGIDEDPDILRTILRNNRRHLGIYCSSETSGTIEQGDEVFVSV